MSPLNPAQVSALLHAAPPRSAAYLIGAGGCGMSGLGHLLIDLGHSVAGSDLILNEEIAQLRARGATIHLGHAAEHLRAARSVVAVYSSAIRADNPELQAAIELKIPVVRRATLLAALVHRQRGICVAGMHGKTTTSALLSFALDQLQARPSYAVGALVPQLERHARFTSHSDFPSPSQPTPSASREGSSLGCPFPLPGGVSGGLVGDSFRESSEAVSQGIHATASSQGSRSTFFVAEADESDGSLREFRPEHAIVLNVDAEHLDYYADLEAVCREFQAFGEHTSGRLVFCADDPRLAELFAKRPGAVSYGWHPLASYRIESAGPPAQPAQRDSRPLTRFEVWHRGQRLGEFATSLLGEMNLSNCAAVIALLHQLGFEPAEISRAIAPFRGAARRQQELFADARFRLFDDYAHHPNEITATLKAMKSLGARRLLVAFQPHRYTRTQHLLKQFSVCFGDADLLWLTEVYPASEPHIPGVDGRLLLNPVRDHGQAVEFAAAPAGLPVAVRAAMRPGDLVAFLGAGDITRAAHELAAQLRQERPSVQEKFLAILSAALSPGTVLRQNEPLAKKTTLRVGGPADFYVEPASDADLATVIKQIG